MSKSRIEEMRRWGRETTNVRRNGEVFPVRLLSDVVRDRRGRLIGIVTTCEDITQRKRAEQALQESEERYELAVRGGKDGLFDWNLESDEIYYSARWKAMLGYDDSEFETSIATWLDRVHEEDVGRLKADLTSQREGSSSHFENEHRIQHKDGEYLWVLARGIVERDPYGKPYRIAGAMTDVTERKGLEAQLAKDALYDHLTGLPNRAFLTDQLERAFLQAERRPEFRFGVLFLDLDRFKVVNDSMGHAAGDQLLVEVSRRIANSIRPGDVAARLGGDEFCVLLAEIRDGSDTTRVAGRIMSALEAPVMLEGREVFISTSIGIAVHEAGLDGPEHLLRHADTALYRAKSRGKARFEVFDHEMHERAVALLQMEDDLRTAVGGSQFRLHYQPVVRLEDEAVTSFEALLRWHHPERGLIPTPDFLPLAEETGLIVPIGNWVMDEACRQMASWIRQFPSLPELTVSVNLSSKQLRQPDLVNRVGQAVSDAGLTPRHLRLEISEQTLMDDADRNVDLIERLRARGIQVQIDDFGTGTSSLTYLHRFSVDTLKIDQSFVSRMGMPGEKAAMINAIINLARDMGITVVAEGIETPDQSAKLLSLQCDRGQGYLFSHPLDADAAADFLAARVGDED
jgi:diguanylate cyclase (GGDEF)-like protein/PAS domain S-box-containing protein